MTVKIDRPKFPENKQPSSRSTDGVVELKPLSNLTARQQTVLTMQRTQGNAAVRRMLTGVLQTKPKTQSEAVTSAKSDKPSCAQPEFAECITNIIAQKQALKAIYEKLAKKHGKLLVNTDSGQAIPVENLDLMTLNQEKRLPMMQQLKKLHDYFNTDEEKETSQVETPIGCGFEGTPVEALETQSVTCQINTQRLDEFRAFVPCKELYDIYAEHEVLHLKACQERLGNKKLPTILQSPTGRAKEEAQAYAQDIAKLQALLSSKQVGNKSAPK